MEGKNVKAPGGKWDNSRIKIDMRCLTGAKKVEEYPSAEDNFLSFAAFGGGNSRHFEELGYRRPGRSPLPVVPDNAPCDLHATLPGVAFFT